MVEYIKRESAYEDFEKCNSENPKWTPSRVKTLIARQEAVDAVPVIRCRECKHCDPENYHCDHPMGTAAPLRRKPDDFCSYGERKEGADRMDVREKLIKQAISYYWYGVSCDIFSEPVATYAKLAIEALEKEKERGVTAQELDGCKYCEEHEDLPEHFVSGKPVGRVFDTCIQTDENGRWHLEVPSGADIGIKFCPMCGRKLPHPPKGE